MWTRMATLAAAVSLIAPPAQAATSGLPLGPPGLPETRTTETLQPGVTPTAIADRPHADDLATALRAAGFTASTVFTGWDGARTDRGPWVVRLLTIDPATFRGDLAGDYGPDLERRETTSAIAAHATAAVNGGSTTMVARGQVINKPSDAAGERPVGDAILVLP